MIVEYLGWGLPKTLSLIIPTHFPYAFKISSTLEFCLPEGAHSLQTGIFSNQLDL